MRATCIKYVPISVHQDALLHDHPGVCGHTGISVPLVCIDDRYHGMSLMQTLDLMIVDGLVQTRVQHRTVL